jgi:muramoyltetrapeptide carboxypeptidase
MSKQRCRIGVVAPASRMSPEVAERVPTLAKSLYPDRTPEIIFHPQCFASHGHFAGDDETRGQAFLDIANDESYDAVWFARGGYGSCRVVEAVMSRLTEPSRRKTYVGYSDAGVLLAALYRAGFETVAHGPVAQDILRDGGEEAVGRALAWMVDLSPEALESTAGRGKMTAAFNMTVLSQLLGTPLQPYQLMSASLPESDRGTALSRNVVTGQEPTSSSGLVNDVKDCRELTLWLRSSSGPSVRSSLGRLAAYRSSTV